jgi:hypothetical protein
VNLKLILIAAGVALLSFGGYRFARAVQACYPQGTDEEQLRAMLRDGAAAASLRRSDGVTRYLSPDYQDEIGMSDSSLAFQIRRYLSRVSRLRVYVPEESVRVSLDGGRTTGSVYFELQIDQRLDGVDSSSRSTVILQVAREPVRSYLFFPGREWKVVSASGYPTNLEGF